MIVFYVSYAIMVKMNFTEWKSEDKSLQFVISKENL